MTSWRCGLMVVAALTALTACGRGTRPEAPAPAAADVERARADSLAAALRSDSIAAALRADSLGALARADSLARAGRAAREDSVRAEVRRGAVDAGRPAPDAGLGAPAAGSLAEPVYFEFDRSDIRPDQVARLESKLAILRANPQLQIMVEGHCDDRGSDEYNLALGNRRAASVKRYFVEHGIAESRIEIVSYGEERPAVSGQSEEAWARNRRAEFRVVRGAR